MRRNYTIAILCLVLLGLVVVLAMWQTRTNRNVITAKGNVIAAHMLRLGSRERLLRDKSLRDPVLGGYLRGKEVDFLAADWMGVSAENPCTDECYHLIYYNYTDGGTIEAIYDEATEQFVRSWQDTTTRPNPSPYVVERVVNVAADDARVKEVLGNLRKAEVAMVPMSTWLADDDCNEDWCVDLTFHDPIGTGKIFHIVVNLSQDKVARTFYTRGRLERSNPFDGLDEEAPLFTDGCHEQYNWDVCWEMTAHDGVNFYSATYDGDLIFNSAKIGQVEAYYPSWPGGYRDEIGSRATVPPKFDTRVTDLSDGFEVRQLFTEPFNWPNCICCYRYEQIIRFFTDGSFEPRFISHGPGCDELSEYRPFWRIDIALGGDGGDQAWYWDKTKWSYASTEKDLNLFSPLSLEGERLATFDGDINYRWQPEPTDPLALDDGRLFVVQYDEDEGATSITAGAADTYHPPKNWIGQEPFENEEEDNLVVWYIPNLKTKKGDPWWCAPDPDPEFSPCHSILRVFPAGELRQPTAEELAQLEAQPTATPIVLVTETPDAENVPTRRPTPRAIVGKSAEEVILNSGCGACHEIGPLGEAGKVGPSLSNIGNLASERVPGQSAETYLYNSILYPNIFIAPDCPNSDCLANIMPTTYHLTLNETQVNTLVTYMLALQETPVVEIGETAATNSNTPNDAAPPPSPHPTTSQQPDYLPPLLIGLVVTAIILVLLILLTVSRRKKDG